MDVGVDVAVGQQAQEVHGLAGLGVGHQILPSLGSIQRAVLDGLAHQLGALRVDLAAAQSVVAHLGVAHILIAGQADGGAVSLQVSMGAGFQQHIQSGGLGDLDRVAAAAVTLANAVHNDQYNRFFHNELPPKASFRVVLHFIRPLILHHIDASYNYFFIFSVPNKKTPGKITKWLIFPEVVKIVLSRLPLWGSWQKSLIFD